MAISRFNFPFAPTSGTNRLSGIRNADRSGTGRAPGRVITSQRTLRSSSIHFASSRALPIVAREQQHANARRRQDDRFFPDVTAILVAEVMRFVEDHQVDAH